MRRRWRRGGTFEPKSSVVVGYRYYSKQGLRDYELEVQRVLDDHGPRRVHDDLHVGRVRRARDVVEDLAVGVAVLLEEVAEEVVDARGVVVRRAVVVACVIASPRRRDRVRAEPHAIDAIAFGRRDGRRGARKQPSPPMRTSLIFFWNKSRLFRNRMIGVSAKAGFAQMSRNK